MKTVHCSHSGIAGVVLFLVLTGSIAGAQTPDSTTSLEAIQVQAESDSNASVLGFESFALEDVPVSSSSYDHKTLEKNQILRLADLTTLDSSLTDSYNATGYWDMISIRGYTLDNRNSFRREGLPINAETSIPLENKDSIQVLKGLSGIQSGVSAPGGVVHYLVKRPTGKSLLNTRMDINDSGGARVTADAGGTFNENDHVSYRVNAGYEYLSPHLQDAFGHRSMIAAAFDVRLETQGLLQWEIELSKRSQPSQPGMSLLGSKLPEVQNPNLNLNNQTWSQPVNFTAATTTLRYSQPLSEKLNSSFTLGLQSLENNDHLAYPFGCTKDGNYDRYCSDGTFDFYDYRSENEKRDTVAARASLDGQFQTGFVNHSWNVGVMGWKSRERYQKQAYNYVGEGKIDGTATVPSNTTLNDESTDRDADNLQIFTSDAIKWYQATAWFGLSWNGIGRSSVRTDGSRATEYYQSFVLPWAALSYQFESWMAYVSYAEGAESFVTPNRNTYSNPGQFLSDVKSDQYEVGFRGGRGTAWSLALFEIRRPVVTDQAPLYSVDGSDIHRGVEAELSHTIQRWNWNIAGMLLETRREGSMQTPGLNGKRAINIPNSTLRIGAEYLTPWASALSLKARASYEGERAVLADNSMIIPGWVCWDAGAGYKTKWNSIPLKTELLVENVLDKKYWRESPTQYGHVYLYPGADRTFLLSLQAEI
ncbi:TonB-dependent siderophore receptor [Bdellovibrio sp. SKB1291214]|uniref:TonB-dependent siderophore receptor n=1 Tax=Bdellovibrio sp. SKB1291214 TaxID=1732569 RepID=UPI000B5185CE|nr:TonB-dependent siderophore receptor [Bdellovibrio sp. SKB1291214]UYL09291.1 TonB-dependent siderophore receptor [Bdellovibrio sp. SKB1291214]